MLSRLNENQPFASLLSNKYHIQDKCLFPIEIITSNAVEMKLFYLAKFYYNVAKF